MIKDYKSSILVQNKSLATDLIHTDWPTTQPRSLAANEWVICVPNLSTTTHSSNITSLPLTPFHLIKPNLDQNNTGVKDHPNLPMTSFRWTQHLSDPPISWIVKLGFHQRNEFGSNISSHYVVAPTYHNPITTITTTSEPMTDHI